ncbi:MAG: protease [Deltaproteobacteria bacterium HGW-Deltaproteobacteria-6]|jgi:protease I|nr:MAG: protease [Deltaproteobacteria bacterium HGW-Deltaproteobacteria-6]
MATIAVIITNMFEDSEYSEPVFAFMAAGHKIVHIGIQAGETVKGIKKGTPVVIDQTLKDLSITGFDALLIPGGYSPDQLRIHADALRFAREFVESGKPVFVICHGPQLLISARVVKGRKITGWKSIKDDLINAGADFVDQEVVEDGNIISSRSPADLPAFITASLRKLPES